MGALVQFEIVHRERQTEEYAVTVVFVISDELDRHPQMLRKTFLIPIRDVTNDEEIDRLARVEAIKFLHRKLRELGIGKSAGAP